MMPKPKPGNRRKQPLRDQKAQRKALFKLASTWGVKALIAGLTLWLLYPIVSKFSIPDWLIPKKAAQHTPAPKAPSYDITYDFYDLLPQEKVVTPELLNHTDTHHLMVQVASFKTVTSAKKLQTKLIRLGFNNVNYDTIKNKKGRWVRVNIGPVNTITLAQQIQKQLQSHGMKKTVIKTIE